MELHTNLSFTNQQADAVLRDWLGSTVTTTAIVPLSGGMVNTVLRLEFAAAPFQAVIKLNVPGQAFAVEARALAHLRRGAGFPCPTVYLEDSSLRSVPYAFLLLEALPGSHLWGVTLSQDERRSIELQLASVLSRLHAHTRPTFGAIAAPGCARWTEVFLPRLQSLRAKPELNGRLAPALLERLDRALGMAERALADQGAPALVHGDLWAANFIAESSAKGYRLSGFVDPKAEYADPELELAYVEEFSCVVGPEFLPAYAAQTPLRPGYERRRLFYWLHSYLEHVWLFEDAVFRDKTAWVVDQIISSAP